ncbi:Undecaprenyl-phosphate 4-deoxy-4-formamido-L-arabinose transferase [Paraburkholderia ultramafica]|uniref:Undecaprenyl-phosphate 4-deoxy-4-formamido-L-arabinose transferase n=1 Tax=Paraburkholderia ultramafica TaxID=1544867 RepID=A0A6S7BRN4_9BURK|nr:Undecaprenyl-phosphate 4-deoxy-4-formamido-L-arabinose transferase [Paraburkholderia ultramafica]
MSHSTVGVRQRISLVVPFHNEAAVLNQFFVSVTAVLRSLPAMDYEIVCVNDGSTDATLDMLQIVCEHDRHVLVVDLSRNFGKEAALTAGIDVATGDAVIPFDADLQDPPEVIPQLVERWCEGYDVVLAKRAERNTDTWAKRATSYSYRLDRRASHSMQALTTAMCSGRARCFSPGHNWRAW